MDLRASGLLTGKNIDKYTTEVAGGFSVDINNDINEISRVNCCLVAICFPPVVTTVNMKVSQLKFNSLFIARSKCSYPYAITTSGINFVSVYFYSDIAVEIGVPFIGNSC